MRIMGGHWAQWGKWENGWEESDIEEEMPAIEIVVISVVIARFFWFAADAIPTK